MNIVSQATKQNWHKLNIKKKGKLTTRANKRLSQKNIMPMEYFYNVNNKKNIEVLLCIIKKEKWNITSVLLSLGINLLKKANLYQKKHVQKVLSTYPNEVIPQLVEYPLPTDEKDILGLIYQGLLLEGQKNKQGSYYTPYPITSNMTKNLDFSKEQIFFDPCCGSGAFFLPLHAVHPEQLYGIDKDETAVMIAKINLLLKFPCHEFTPQIYCKDYLKQNNFDTKFDYIVTNPPWGALSQYSCNITEVTSKETFSYFFVLSFEHLKSYGTIRFLFPESILNVKLHKDIRTFLLEKGCLKAITIYQELFTGVTTKYIDIECQKAKQNEKVAIYEGQQQKQISISTFYHSENKVFHFIDTIDMKMIEQIKKNGIYTLSNSIWAIGIVTGDNKNKLKEQFFEGCEPIYTGKEISKYCLNPPKKYILYDRSQFQQVAQEKYYRANEKLVYKFISKKLVFAYDNTKSLFLNSANILIPNVPNMSIKTVMAYLNSELFQYLYTKLFGEVKILKGNLILLPFPKITEQQNNIITKIVNELLKGKNENNDTLQKIIFYSYGLNQEQMQYIKGQLEKD